MADFRQFSVRPLVVIDGFHPRHNAVGVFFHRSACSLNTWA